MNKSMFLAIMAFASAHAAADCSIFPAPVSEDPECMVEYWASEAEQAGEDPENLYGDPIANNWYEFRACHPRETSSALYHSVFDVPVSLASNGETTLLVSNDRTNIAPTVAFNFYEYDPQTKRHELVSRVVEPAEGVVRTRMAEDGSAAFVSSQDDKVVRIFERNQSGQFQRSHTIADAHVGVANSPRVQPAYDSAAGILFVPEYDAGRTYMRAFRKVGGNWQEQSRFHVDTKLLTYPEHKGSHIDSIWGGVSHAVAGRLFVGASRFGSDTTGALSGAVTVLRYTADGTITNHEATLYGMAFSEVMGTSVNVTASGDLVVGISGGIRIYKNQGGYTYDGTQFQDLLRGHQASMYIGQETVVRGDDIYVTVFVRPTTFNLAPWSHISLPVRAVKNQTGSYDWAEKIIPTTASGLGDNHFLYATPLVDKTLLTATVSVQGITSALPQLSMPSSGKVALYDFDPALSPACEQRTLPDRYLLSISQAAQPDGYCFYGGISEDPDCSMRAIENGVTNASEILSPARQLVDVDNDLWPDAVDNCPYDANSDQSNIDGDAEGDVCDGDIDGDGEPNEVDDTPSGEDVAEHERLLDNALAQAQPHLDGADQDGDGDFDRNDLDVLLGLEFESYRPMFGDGSSSAPRDQMLYLAGNRLINMLNRISEGDAPGAIVEGAQTYLEVMASAFGTSGGRNELLRAPAETAIDALD